MSDPAKKPDSKSPNPDSTPSDDKPPIDYGAFNESVKALADAARAMQTSGASKEEAVQKVSQESGLKAEDLTKLIDEYDSKGSVGAGVVQVIQQVTSAFQAQSLERDGRREVDALKYNDDFAKPIAEKDGKPVSIYATYGPGFREWMQKNGYSYAHVADADAASKMFRYYLSAETDYVDRRSEYLAKATKPTVETPTGKHASPSMRPGAAPEGGIGPRLVRGIYEEDSELSDEQTAVMDAFGLSDEQKKRAGERQSKKTIMGTPLDFVTTRNEGGV